MSAQNEPTAANDRDPRGVVDGGNPTGAEECRKCGGADINTTYHAKGCDKPGGDCANCLRHSNAKRHDEHLHLTCRACGWDWTKDVLSRG